MNFYENLIQLIKPLLYLHHIDIHERLDNLTPPRFIITSDLGYLVDIQSNSCCDESIAFWSDSNPLLFSNLSVAIFVLDHLDDDIEAHIVQHPYPLSK